MKQKIGKPFPVTIPNMMDLKKSKTTWRIDVTLDFKTQEEADAYVIQAGWDLTEQQNLSDDADRETGIERHWK